MSDVAKTFCVAEVDDMTSVRDGPKFPFTSIDAASDWGIRVGRF